MKDEEPPGESSPSKREAELVSPEGDEESGDSEGLTPAPRILREFLAMFRTSGGAPVFHPIFDRFKDSHVDKFLDHSHEEDMERLGVERRRPWFVLAYVALALAFLVFLVVTLLPQDKDLLGEIVKLGIAFAGGVGGGYGLRAYQEARRADR